MASDMKIKTRLILGFGIVILLAVGIGLSSYVAISALSNDVQDLGKRRLPQIIILGDLTENILVATTHLQKAFLVDNRADLDKAIESMLKTRKGITDAFDKLKVLVQTEKGKALYQAMVDARKPNADMRNQIVKALQEGNKKEALRGIEWVISDRIEHTGQDLESEIFLIPESIGSSLNDPYLVVQPLHKA